MRKALYFIIFLALHFQLFAQNEISSSTHKVLGANVDGYEVNIPFGKAMVRPIWDSYAKRFGRSEPTADYMSYQSVYDADLYDKEVLLFAKLSGDETSSKLWAGIDPQGVPKDTLKRLQDDMREFVYNFNIRVRKDMAQKKIDQSEQAATYLSKEFESLKRDERKNERNLLRTNERIVKYEHLLVGLRQDSITYNKNLKSLAVELDSAYLELEKVKNMVELYKQQLEAID